MNVIIIHGVGGHPQENWFPWLKKELEEIGHKVGIPQFPKPETLPSWLEIIKAYNIDKETILVGHSLGVPFILNILEKSVCHSAFLVSGFVGKLDNEFDNVTKTFAQKEFEWSSIKKNCSHFEIFHSDNDPFVKIEKAYELQKNLNCELTIIKNGGHLNQSSGFTKFSELLKKIKKIKN
jgi:uncharacterized protein